MNSTQTTLPPLSVDSGLESLGVTALILGAIALVYAYRLTNTKNGLESQILKDKALLNRIRQEIKAERETLDRLRADAKQFLDDRVGQEMKKTGSAKEVKKEGLRQEYWGRISQMSGKVEDPELKRLMGEKAEIQSMIEITKTKYHTRAIDEKSFSNITEGYQKRLIEIEARISKLKDGENRS
ncbi:MAG: hypothetical protein V1744_01020 [Candidatus Altiarchaeota archaeon]